MNRASFKAMALEEFQGILNKMVPAKRTRELMLSAFSDGLQSGLDFDAKAADWARAHGFVADSPEARAERGTEPRS